MEKIEVNKVIEIIEGDVGEDLKIIGIKMKIRNMLRWEKKFKLRKGEIDLIEVIVLDEVDEGLKRIRVEGMERKLIKIEDGGGRINKEKSVKEWEIRIIIVR